MRLLVLLVFVLSSGLLPVAAQSTPVPCPDALPARLTALDDGRALQDGDDATDDPVVAIYAEPSGHAERLGDIPAGGVFNVLNSTRCAEGMLWHEIVYRGTVGWITEGDAVGYFVEPNIVELVALGSTQDDLGAVMTDWLKLMYDPSLANDVTLALVPGYTLPDSISPRPRSANFYFEGFPAHYPDELCCQMTPLIAVYPVSGFLEISDTFAEHIDALATLIEERPVLHTYQPDDMRMRRDDDLPMLPRHNAVQVFALAPRYIDFANGAGVRYVTAYAQQLAEFDQYTLFYTFQGLTDDGASYVSAQFPLVLPADALPLYIEGDYDDMASWYWPYFAELVGNLNALEDADYAPDSRLLDEMMASMQVGVVE